MDFRTRYQHGTGVIQSIKAPYATIVTTEVYSTFDDTPMVAGYEMDIILYRNLN